uniref:Unclassified n=3 Tax=Fusarium pseudograminearum TaxID=101028 RepID=W1ICB5_FUSPS|nr:unclassified [Fusarium pseudograminearum CS3220]CDL73103.1 unclassified [Fusarium pseudograminearum CS3427]CDL73186.1 unclassified [Fusarium pseudograminearum CS3487]CDX48311.1 unclassified [Fusarium pseudograminearum CS3487]CDX48408.1 unclassified [Fusarium pseudograminearum CS3427]
MKRVVLLSLRTRDFVCISYPLRDQKLDEVGPPGIRRVHFVRGLLKSIKVWKRERGIGEASNFVPGASFAREKKNTHTHTC